MADIYFVLTAGGDRGPFDRERIADELRAGAINPDDRLRNPWGKSTGTVAELLGSSGSAAELRPRSSAAAPRQRPQRPPFLVIGVIAGAVVLLATVLVLRPAPTMEVGAPPMVAAITPPPVSPPAHTTVAPPPRPRPPTPVALPPEPSVPGTPPVLGESKVADIGGAEPAPPPTLDVGRWQISGRGRDVGGAADQFRFVSGALEGDITISAKLATFTGGLTTAKAGLMVRTSLDPGSPFVYLALAQSGQVQCYSRAEQGAVPLPSANARATPAHWLRLVRRGTTYSAFHSSDGHSWTALGTPLTIPRLAGTVLIGVAVCSGDNTPAEAVFKQASIAP